MSCKALALGALTGGLLALACTANPTVREVGGGTPPPGAGPPRPGGRWSGATPPPFSVPPPTGHHPRLPDPAPA